MKENISQYNDAILELHLIFNTLIAAIKNETDPIKKAELRTAALESTIETQKIISKIVEIVKASKED